MEDVTIVGTAHVSEKSAREVRETIREEQPDYVAVELDPRRYDSVKERDDEGYGGDMAAAVNEAEEQGIPVVLIDRDVQVTVRRFWSEMSMFERIKTVGGILAGILGIRGVRREEIERAIEEGRVSEYVDELREFSPGGARVLIDERDAYMADRIDGLDGSVVAVVGAGHQEGIEQHLDNPDDIPEVPGDGEERYVPSDIHDTGEEFILHIDLPGYESEDIDLEVMGRTLTVEANRDEHPPDGFRYIGNRRPDHVKKEIELPRRVNAGAATAKQEDGVLRVTLPRR